MNWFFQTEPKELTIQVLISEPGGNPHRPTAAIIDTGATLCVIHADLARNLGLPTVTSTAVKTFGQPSATGGHPVVECQVLAGNVGPLTVRAVIFSGDDEFILGMNWCNQVNGSYTRQSGGWQLQIDP